MATGHEPGLASSFGSVYVVSGEELVRRGFRGVLEANGFSVSGESGSVRQAARLIPALRPDLPSSMMIFPMALVPGFVGPSQLLTPPFGAC